MHCRKLFVNLYPLSTEHQEQISHGGDFGTKGLKCSSVSMDTNRGKWSTNKMLQKTV